MSLTAVEVFTLYLEGELTEEEARASIERDWGEVRYEVVIEGDVDSSLIDE